MTNVTIHKRRSGKHIPQRTCVGCRQVLAKKELLRIVRSPDGVQVEQQERLAGRGAYLHTNRSCWQKALNASLSKALRTDFTEQDIDRLQAYMQALPESEPQDKNKIEQLNA